VKARLGEKNAKQPFPRKIKRLGVKQSFHIREQGAMGPAYDRFAMRVHNLGPQKQGWNNE